MHPALKRLKPALLHDTLDDCKIEKGRRTEQLVKPNIKLSSTSPIPLAPIKAYLPELTLKSTLLPPLLQIHLLLHPNPPRLQPHLPSFAPQQVPTFLRPSPFH